MSAAPPPIWCCGCGAHVAARLTNGAEIYPRRPDLKDLPFWRCDTCRNFVGCHHKTANPTRPLGCIPTPEIKRARQHIHRLLDPIWKEGHAPRRQVYSDLAQRMGQRSYHTANIRTIEEARQVYREIKKLRDDMIEPDLIE